MEGLPGTDTLAYFAKASVLSCFLNIDFGHQCYDTFFIVTELERISSGKHSSLFRQNFCKEKFKNGMNLFALTLM